MNKITYLLGAGASANALPLVQELPFRLGIFATYMNEHLSVQSGIKEYINDIRELNSELNEYTTIDGYAKTLSQNKVDGNTIIKLNKLKSILCGLFTFEQLKKRSEPFALSIKRLSDEYNQTNYLKIERTLDPRYKSFFAKVLSNSTLNENINIISWNYDLQLEIGLENNLGYKYLELDNTCRIYPHPLYGSFNSPRNFQMDYYNTPQIVKLNGTAGIYLRDESFFNIYVDQKEYFEDLMPTLLEAHKEVTGYNKFKPFLNFAWEQDDRTKRSIDYAHRMLGQSEVLVVIGYSFPDFNRAVDRQIFEGSQLREIYLQLPENDFETVSYNLKASLRNDQKNVILRRDLREFFLPKQF